MPSIESSGFARSAVIGWSRVAKPAARNTARVRIVGSATVGRSVWCPAPRHADSTSVRCASSRQAKSAAPPEPGNLAPAPSLRPRSTSDRSIGSIGNTSLRRSKLRSMHCRKRSNAPDSSASRPSTAFSASAAMTRAIDSSPARQRAWIGACTSPELALPRPCHAMRSGGSSAGSRRSTDPGSKGCAKSIASSPSCDCTRRSSGPARIPSTSFSVRHASSATRLREQGMPYQRDHARIAAMRRALEPESPAWKGMSLVAESANGRATGSTPRSSSRPSKSAQPPRRMPSGIAIDSESCSSTVATSSSTAKPRPLPP